MHSFAKSVNAIWETFDYREPFLMYPGSFHVVYNLVEYWLRLVLGLGPCSGLRLDVGYLWLGWLHLKLTTLTV